MTIRFEGKEILDCETKFLVFQDGNFTPLFIWQ